MKTAYKELLSMVLIASLVLGLFFAFFSKVIQQGEERQKQELVKAKSCKDPVFLQAVGHEYSTGWVYGCADGSMIELPQPLPSAPIGTPDGWAGGR